MSLESARILVVVLSVWGILVAIKAANVLRTGNSYTFSMWDGGMLRAGKRLTRMGAQIKLVVGAAMAVGCLLAATDVIPWRTGGYVLIFVAVLSLCADFVTVERS
jgi:hypothetical protein